MTAASFTLTFLQPDNPPAPLPASFRHQCHGTDTIRPYQHDNRVLKESSLAVRYTEGMPALTRNTPRTGQAESVQRKTHDRTDRSGDNRRNRKFPERKSPRSAKTPGAVVIDMLLSRTPCNQSALLRTARLPVRPSLHQIGTVLCQNRSGQ